MNKVTDSKNLKAPERTIERLCLYRRILRQMEEEGKETASSYEIGKRADILDSQVRKDLSLFGQFGVAGRGYKIKDLRSSIEEIVGKNRIWRIAIVGAGNLGSSLLGYRKFEKEGFEIVAAFDSDLRKVGKVCSGVTVEDVRDIVEVLRKKGVDIGITTVPANAAQQVTDCLVEAGVKAILNFAPCRLEVPEDVKVLNVDLNLRLEVLSHFLSAIPHKKEIVN